MNHKHRWMFLTTKNAFEPFTPSVKWIEAHPDAMMELYDDVGVNQLYKMNEYAYLICNGPDHEVMVRKVLIEKLDQVELAGK